MFSTYYYSFITICAFWSIAGLIFLLWAIGQYAKRLNRDQGSWIFIAIVFSPIIAFLSLYMVGEKKIDGTITNRPSTSSSRESEEEIQKKESNELSVLWFVVFMALALILVLSL